MRKYIVFPNVAFSVYNGALSILKCGDKVRLLFWGEDGKPSEKFPKGYALTNEKECETAALYDRYNAEYTYLLGGRCGELYKA